MCTITPFLNSAVASEFDFYIFVLKKMIFSKQFKIDDFYIKIMNFDEFCKKNSPSGDQKVRLTTNMSPAADCIGAKRRRKLSKNLEIIQKF